MLSWWFRHKRFTSTYLALGDSIISDCYPGKDRGAASLVFRNHDRDFPEFHGRDLAHADPLLQSLNLSRSGYRIADVAESLRCVPPDALPSYVLISVGGNDLLSGQWDRDRFRSGYAALLAEVRRRWPQARLAVVNAYDPSDGSGLRQSSIERGLPPDCTLLPELEWMNEQIGQMAEEALVDLYSHCLGHGVLHADPSFAHYRPGDPSLWFQRDIEPNGRGASEVRRLVAQKFGL